MTALLIQRIYAFMYAGVRRLAREEDGASLVEYGLLVALVAVVVMATMAVLGVRINAMFCSVVNQLGGTCP